MKIKVCDATNNQLNWLVAKSLGWITYPTDSIEMGMWYNTDPNLAPFGPKRRVSWFRPSTDWMDGGPIIEQEFILLDGLVISDNYRSWSASIFEEHMSCGQTPLIAAMQCYIISKLGKEVEVPDNLI